MNTTAITARAICKMSAKEMNSILKITGYLPEKKKNAVIFQINPRFTTEVVRELRMQGITCLCEQYLRNGKFTVLKKDIEKTKEILEEKSIEYSVA